MKPTYSELKKRVAELEKEAADCRSAEASLRWSNGIVNSILSASPIGIGLVENRIVKRINGAMMRMFRYESEADYIGKSARIMYPSEEDFQRVGDFIYNYLKAGKEAWLDAIFQRKDGTTFPCEIQGRMIFLHLFLIFRVHMAWDDHWMLELNSFQKAFCCFHPEYRS